MFDKINQPRRCANFLNELSALETLGSSHMATFIARLNCIYFPVWDTLFRPTSYWLLHPQLNLVSEPTFFDQESYMILNLILLFVASVSAFAANSTLPMETEKRSCVHKTLVEGVKEGDQASVERDALGLGAQWKVAGRMYGMTYSMQEALEDGSRTVLITAESTLIALDKNFFVTESKSKHLSLSSKLELITEREELSQYYERISSSEGIYWSWKDGSKGERIAHVRTEKFPDGSEKSVSERLDHPVNDGYRLKSSVSTCVSQPISKEVWLALIDKSEVSDAVRNLDDLIPAIAEAELAWKNCGGVACEEKKAALSLLVDRFQGQWESIFSQLELIEKEKADRKKSRLRQEARMRQKERARAVRQRREQEHDDWLGRAIKKSIEESERRRAQKELKDIKEELEKIKKRRDERRRRGRGRH